MEHSQTFLVVPSISILSATMLVKFLSNSLTKKCFYPFNWPLRKSQLFILGMPQPQRACVSLICMWAKVEKCSSLLFTLSSKSYTNGFCTDVLLVSLGWHHKMVQNRELKQQKCIFSWFWRLEVQDQGIGRFGFSWGLSSACRWPPLAAFSHVLESLVSLSVS